MYNFNFVLYDIYLQYIKIIFYQLKSRDYKKIHPFKTNI